MIKTPPSSPGECTEDSDTSNPNPTCGTGTEHTRERGQDSEKGRQILSVYYHPFLDTLADAP